LNTLISDNWLRKDLRPFAVLASLFISLYTILLPDSPNDDAYIYIRTAEIVLDQGIGAAFEHYSWATYSILIAALGSIGIDLFLAAHIINAAFYALLVYVFLSIVREITNDEMINALAVLCVLLYPELNELRYLIIRDVGYWTFSLLAIYLFMRYLDTARWQTAVAYTLSFLFAATMRPEALIYMLLLPLTLFLLQVQSRNTLLVRIYSVVCALGIAALLILGMVGVNIISLFASFVASYVPFLQTLINPDPAEEALIASVLFGEYAGGYSDEYIVAFFATGLLAILFGNVFNAIGWPYFLLLIAGVWRRMLLIPRTYFVVLLWIVILNLLILFVFLFVTRYLTSRYAMLMSLVLLAFVPVILAEMLRRVSDARKQLLRNSLVVLFVYCTVDAFISFGDSKDYVFEAADWITANTTVSTTLITNNHAIAYKSGRVEEYDYIPRYIGRDQIAESQRGDIIALEWSVEMEGAFRFGVTNGQIELLQTFADEDNNRVEIYRRL